MTLLFVAIGLGVLGAFLAMLYLNARESSLRDLLKPKSALIGIVVASKDLLKGDVLDGSTLSIRDVPENYVDNNAVRPEQFEAIKGKILQQNLSAGRMLMSSYIGSHFPLDFSDTIALKRRAMTIQVDEMSTFTGLLRPGNRIDLFVNISIGDADEKSIMPVLENVEVLTTGRDSAHDYTEKVRFLRGGVDAGINQAFTTVTLNVTAKEGAILASARDKGDLLALLRNREDNSGSGFSVISNNDVLANAKQLARKEELRRSTEQLRNSIVVGEDGVLRNKDGVALVNQNLIIGEDGTIRTKSGIDLSSRGLTLNAKGEIVDKDGNIIDPDALLIAADGTLMTQDGRVLDGEKVKNLVGAKQLADGSVLLADGSIIKGATLDANGNLVMTDGSLINAEDVSNVLNVGTSVDYLAGGISKDGILTVQKLPVAK
jgi:pilus assembly protein CpaB